MQRYAASLALLLIAAASPVVAQSIGEPIPGRGASKSKLKPAEAAQAARPCPAYGPGFVRLEGSSLCVRVGGSARVEFGRSSRSGYGSSTSGAVRVESRGESGFGPVRSVVQVRGHVDRGLETSPFR